MSLHLSVTDLCIVAPYSVVGLKSRFAVSHADFSDATCHSVSISHDSLLTGNEACSFYGVISMMMRLECGVVTQSNPLQVSRGIEVVLSLKRKALNLFIMPQNKVTLCVLSENGDVRL